MKKMKLYMLLLLVPLILMGCIEKGKPASGISVDVSGTGGYTWEQLKVWIYGNEYDTSFSINSNIDEVKRVQKNYLSSTSVYKDADKLITNLEQFKSEVRTESSSFNYSLLSSNINKYNSASVNLAGILTETELEWVEKRISSEVASSVAAPVWLTDLKKDVTNTLRDIQNRKLKNKVYASFPDLHGIYKGASGLEANYDNLVAVDIDIRKLNVNSSVSTALTTITKEIVDLAYLSDELTTFKQESSLNTKLVFLKGVYSGYLNGTKSLTNIYDTLDDLNDYENDLLADTSDEPYLFKVSVDNVYVAINNYSSIDPDKMAYRNEIKSRLVQYQDLNNQYDKQNFTLINSKIVNVMKTYYYLYQQRSNLKNTLGITL